MASIGVVVCTKTIANTVRNIKYRLTSESTNHATPAATVSAVVAANTGMFICSKIILPMMNGIENAVHSSRIRSCFTRAETPSYKMKRTLETASWTDSCLASHTNADMAISRMKLRAPSPPPDSLPIYNNASITARVRPSFIMRPLLLRSSRQVLLTGADFALDRGTAYSPFPASSSCSKRCSTGGWVLKRLANFWEVLRPLSGLEMNM